MRATKKYVLFGILACVSSIVLLFGVHTLVQMHTVHTSVESNTGPYVILLHGLGRSSVSMLPLGVALAEQNYRVVNVGYPSRSFAIEELSDRAVKRTIADIITKDSSAEIHIVTHSLGGILVRYYLSQGDSSNIASVVMLSPPHQGSRTADYWAITWLGRTVLGPAISQLQTSDDSFVRSLPTPTTVSIGIISGLQDGKVSAADTLYTTSTPTIVVSHGHTFIMQEGDTIGYILKFLKEHSF